MLRMWMCCFLPWHRWTKCAPVSPNSDKLTCSCGREYGMNNDQQIMLPWWMVKTLYSNRQS
jgi:hypothetical protein